MIAYVSGSPIVATPYGLAAPVASVKTVEFDANPHYSYTYSVNDAHTGDSKSQSETRQGDVVTGQYSFIEADGTRRIVDYTADDIHGFNAVVRKEGAVKVVAPVAKVVSPYGYPAAHVAHPVAAYGAYHAPIGKNKANNEKNSISLNNFFLIIAAAYPAYHGSVVAKAVAPAYPYYG